MGRARCTRPLPEGPVAPESRIATRASADSCLAPPSFAALQARSRGRMRAGGPKRCSEPQIASRRHCVEQASLTPFIVRVALCPLIQNSMSASA
jgi:hypothetical protein